MKKILSLMIIFLLSFVAVLSSSGEYSKFGYNDIRLISPHIIIDHSTLISDEGFNTFVDQYNNAVSNITNYKIRLMIESGGGEVKKGLEIGSALFELKELYAFDIECHVTQAASMAFTLMVTLCSEIIVYGDNFSIMSHQAYNYYSESTAGTKILDIQFSNAEARSLGLDDKKWLTISRQSDVDKFYTKDELIKYKITTKFRKLSL